MYTIVKEIRNKTTEELRVLLSLKLEDMQETFDGILEFRLHGQNYRFVKFLLSRMTAWVEQQSSMNTSFMTYYEPESGKPFEVEHIWPTSPTDITLNSVRSMNFGL